MIENPPVAILEVVEAVDEARKDGSFDDKPELSKYRLG
jgi:hypothetical protein